jgi:hypothetical protein
MPTESRNLSETFKAILSVSEVTLEEFTLYGAERPVRAYRLVLDQSRPIVLDKMHAEALIPYGVDLVLGES